MPITRNDGVDHCKSQEYHKTPIGKHQRSNVAKDDYPRMDWSQTVCREWFRHCLYEPLLVRALLPPLIVL